MLFCSLLRFPKIENLLFYKILDNLCTFLIKDPKKYILSPAALKITIMSRGYLITEASTGGAKGAMAPPELILGGIAPQKIFPD